MAVPIHTLKTVGPCWDAVERGEKRFEVRINDRFFQPGDIVRLRRIDEDGTYTTRDGKSFTTKDMDFKIGWILQGGQFGIAPGYIVFQLEPVNQ